MSLSPQELERFVRDLAAHPGLWADYVRLDSDERVYEIIWDDSTVNAWLICWNEDSDTGFHDHDRSAAAITVIHGAILEERMRADGPPRGHVHEAGTTVNLPPTAIHRVLHAGEGTAVTIHAYSPPLTRTGAYRVTPDGLLEREVQGIESELKPSAVPAL
jgi:hypothetical protein